MTEGNTEIPLFSAAFNEIKIASACNSIAGILGNLRERLVANGFTREEALALCSIWLSVTIPRAHKQ